MRLSNSCFFSFNLSRRILDKKLTLFFRLFLMRFLMSIKKSKSFIAFAIVGIRLCSLTKDSTTFILWSKNMVEIILIADFCSMSLSFRAH